MPAMRQSNIHLDILMGRDEHLDVADVFEGTSQPTQSITGMLIYNSNDLETESAPPLDIHAQMEKKLRMA